MTRWVGVLAAASVLACSGNVGTLPCTNDGQCGDGQVCGADGKCVTAQACPAGQTLCADSAEAHACYDLTSSPSHCGSCDKACTAPANATATCASSVCGFACTAPAVAYPDGQCRLAQAVVAAVAVSDTEIDLSWPAVAGADGYVLTRDQGGTQTSQTLPAPSGSTVTFHDTGLLANRNYSYTVEATLAANTSIRSLKSTAAAATTLVSAPANLRVTSTGTTSVALAWDAVAGATSYSLLRAPDGGTAFVAIQTSLTATTATDATASAGAAYLYKVQAFRGTLGGVLMSGSVRGVTGLAAPALNPVNPATDVTDTTVLLSWSAVADAATYTVLRAPDAVTPGTQVGLTDQLQFTDNTALPGTMYWYTVAANNNVVTGGTQSSATIVTTTIQPPLSVSAVAGSSTTAPSVALSWPVAPNGAGAYATYLVNRDTASGGSFTASVAGTPSCSSTTCTLTDSAPQLVPGTQYFYRVKSHTSVATSAGTTSLGATTPIGAPALSAGSITTSSVPLTWPHVPGAVSYLIKRSTTATCDATSTTIAAAVQDSTCSGGVCTTTDSTVSAGTAYTYCATTTGASATSAFSSGLSATSKLGIPAFSGTCATATPGCQATTIAGVTSVAVTWSTVTNATSYAVLRAVDQSQSGAANCPATLSPVQGATNACTSTNSTSCTDNDPALVVGTRYCYQVKALDAATSSLSANATATTPIEAPISLAADVSVPGQAKLTWVAPAGGAAFTFQAQRCTGKSSPPCTPFFTVGTTSGLTFTDTTPNGATRYTYRVLATTPAATSPASNVADALVQLVTPQPLSSPGANAAAIAVHWPNSPGADSYNLFTQLDLGDGGVTDAGSAVISASGPCNSTDCSQITDAGIRADSTYYFSVQAIGHPDGTGQAAVVSGVSPALGVNSGLGAVAAPTASAQSPSSVLLTWTPLRALLAPSGYTLYRAGGASGATFVQVGAHPTVALFGAPTHASYTDVGLAPNTTYTYKIATTVNGVDGDVSGTTTVTTPNPTASAPGQPTGLTAVEVPYGQIQLTWTAPTGTVSQYNVYRSYDQGQSYQFLAATGTATASYLDACPDSGNFAITYAVEPVGALSTTTPVGPWSAPATVYIHYPPPPTGVDAGVTTSGGNNTVNVTWTAVQHATQYDVFYSPSGAAGTFLLNNGSHYLGTSSTTSFSTTALPQGSAPYLTVVASSPNSCISSTLAGAARVSLPFVAGVSSVAVASQTATNSGDVVVSWPAVAGAQGYVVQRAPDGVTFSSIGSAIPTTTTTSFIDYTIGSIGSGYVWRVAPWTPTAQLAFTNSAPFNVVTSGSGKPGLPTAIFIASGAAQQPKITWTTTVGTNYQLLRSSDSTNFSCIAGCTTPITASATSTSFTDTGVSPGVTYYYSAQSIAASGAHGLPSSPVMVNVPPTLQASGAQVASGGAQVSVAWTAAAGATSYKLYRDVVQTVQLANPIYSDVHNSFTDKTAAAGTTYFYAVVAQFPGGAGQASVVGSATTGAGVTGTRFANYVTVPNGTLNESNQPLDLSSTTIQAYVPQGSQYSVLQGIGTFDGNFTIGGVPAGATYFIQVNTQFFQTNARTVDLGYDVMGRPNVALSSVQPSNLFLSFSGLKPWQATDILETQSNDALHYWFGINTPNTGPISGGPVPGETQVVNLTLDSTSANGGTAGLIDGVQHDDFTLFELPTHPVHDAVSNGSVNINTLDQALFLEQATFQQLDGVDIVVPVTGNKLIPVPQSSSLAVRFDAASFTSALLSGTPGSAVSNAGLGVDSFPGSSHGQLFATTDFIIFTAPDPTKSYDLASVTYGDPFAAAGSTAWSARVNAIVNAVANHRLPTVPEPRQAALSLFYSDTIPNYQAAVASGLLRPPLAPPQAIKVAGQDATQPLAGVGATPTISWTAPAFGTANYYVVHLFRYAVTPSSDPNTAPSVGRLKNFAVLTTPQTTLTLPPGLLAAGAGLYYYAQIEAVHQPTYDLVNHPLRSFGVSFTAASAVTNIFAP